MKSTTINNAIKEVRELFNELRSNLSREETNKIRKELYKFLKEEDSLTNKEKIMLKNFSKYFKQLKKLHKYQDNVMYGLDYLFNEEDYCEPKEIKSAFDVSFILYESKGDKDVKLTL